MKATPLPSPAPLLQSPLPSDRQDDERMEATIKELFSDKVIKVLCGGQQSALLTAQGRVYTFGHSLDGRLGQQKFEGHTYLYDESKPNFVA